MQRDQGAGWESAGVTFAIEGDGAKSRRFKGVGARKLVLHPENADAGEARDYDPTVLPISIVGGASRVVRGHADGVALPLLDRLGARELHVAEQTVDFAGDAIGIRDVAERGYEI